MTKISREFSDLYRGFRIQRAADCDRLHDLANMDVKPDYDTVVDTCADVASAYDLDPDDMQEVIARAEAMRHAGVTSLALFQNNPNQQS